MIPQLPNGSNIRIAPISNGYEVTRNAPAGGRWGRVFLAGFLFLWLIGWTVAGRDTIKDLGDPQVPWVGKAFGLFWIVGWTVCGGLTLVFFVGILRKPRSVRLVIEPDRLGWTPPYAWMTRWPRSPFRIKQDGRVAKDGSVIVPLSEVSSVALHEPTHNDDPWRCGSSAEASATSLNG